LDSIPKLSELQVSWLTEDGMGLFEHCMNRTLSDASSVFVLE
jgi:hypothetical protein